MAQQQATPHGWIVLNKPAGLSSGKVVGVIRRFFGGAKTGHAGTLDPLATGLMIMLIGKATKVSQFLISLDKAYEGTFVLGVETNSQDSDGEIVERRDLPDDLSEDMIRNEMKQFLGDQYQTPPMFSAKKIDGVPLYKMARKGKTVEREPRVIRINELTLTNWSSPQGEFFMDCSKGTYVRTVFHDLGQNLGCGGHLTSLRRTKINDFSIEGVSTLEEIEHIGTAEFQSLLIPVHEAVPAHVL